MGLASFNFLGDAKWSVVMPVVVTILTVIAIAVMSQRRIKGGILWGIVGDTVCYYPLGLTVPRFYANFSIGTLNPIDAFADFGKLSLGRIFSESFEFSAYIAAYGEANLVLVLATSAPAFGMVDMLDTIGTLYGTCANGDLLNEDGELPIMNRAMLADAIATMVGTVCDTSTVTTYVESTTGIAEGGRTGLTLISAAVMFFIAMSFLSVAALIPNCATAAALIYVGVLMIDGIKNIDWSSPAAAVSAFLTMVLMPFTFNISYGIAFGIISSVLISVFSGNSNEIKATHGLLRHCLLQCLC